MKNEENRNPEQQDRLIRETFEQYRAGMESMPSQRAKIVYRMTQKTAPDYRVYYRLAAVAAALVLLLGIVVPTVGGNSGLFRWPDQKRNVPDLVAAQPAPTDFVPLTQPEEQPEYLSRISCSDPELADSLIPVNISCEKQGIRLEMLYGTVREDKAMFIYSLQDMEGKDRINELTENPVFPLMSGFDSYEDVLSEYDAENQRLIGGMVIHFQDLASHLEESAISLRMSDLEVCNKVTATYEQPRRETVIPGLVEVPGLMDYYIKSINEGKREYYTTEDYREAGMKVIDYSRPAGRILSDHVLLSHAEAYGDEFHVQLQYTDWAYWPLRDVDVVLLGKEGRETTPGWNGHMRWDTDGDGDPDFEEFVFPIDPEGTGPIRFRIDITETTDTLEDNWEVKVPLADVWTGASPQPEIVTAEADLDYIAKLEKVTSSGLISYLVPVGLSCEDEGIRLDVVCAAADEHEALIVYTVQDLEGDRINKNTYITPYMPCSPADAGETLITLEYNDAEHLGTHAVRYKYNSLSEFCGNSAIPLAIPEIFELSSPDIPLQDLLREYDGHAGLVELPQLLEYKVKNNRGGVIEYYTTEDYRRAGLKVLDYSSPLSVPLSGDISLSGIGIIDGMIHVQLQYRQKGEQENLIDYLNSMPAVNMFWIGTGTDAGLPAWTRGMRWDVNGDGLADFEEYAFPCDPENLENLYIELSLVESRLIAAGNWNVDIPLADILTDQAKVPAE